MASLMIKPNIISFLDVATRIGDVELDLEEVIIKKTHTLKIKPYSKLKSPKKQDL